MMNTKLSVSIHILSLIATAPRISSDMIAKSVTTNPVVVRRFTSALKKAGLVESRAGVSGFVLTRDPSAIRLYDVYKALGLDEEMFSVHGKPNPACPVGRSIQGALDVTFASVQERMEEGLKAQTLEDVIGRLGVSGSVL